MLLVDHKNTAVKVALILAISVIFTITAMKTGHIKFDSHQSAPGNITSIIPASKPQSQAFMNPVTGEFEQKASPGFALTETEEALPAASAMMASRSLVASAIAGNTSIQDYNGSKVIAMPAHLRSRLIATRSADGQKIETHHESASANESSMQQGDK